MKTIRKFTRNSLFVVLMSLSFLLVSCFKDQGVTLSAQFTGKELMAAIYFADGPALEKIPELKRSINISLFINDPNQLNQIRESYGLLLDKLEENEPGTYADFKIRMESGDHILIRETIDQYGIKITSLLKSEYGLDVYNRLVKNQDKFIKIISKYESNPTDQYSAKRLIDNPDFVNEITALSNEIKEGSINGKISSTESATCVWLFAGAVAWVVVAYAVLAWIYFWTGVEVDWDFGGSYAITPGGGLLKDQVVNSIASNIVIING